MGLRNRIRCGSLHPNSLPIDLKSQAVIFAASGHGVARRVHHQRCQGMAFVACAVMPWVQPGVHGMTQFFDQHQANGLTASFFRNPVGIQVNHLLVRHALVCKCTGNALHLRRTEQGHRQADFTAANGHNHGVIGRRPLVTGHGIFATAVKNCKQLLFGLGAGQKVDHHFLGVGLGLGQSNRCSRCPQVKQFGGRCI